MAAKYPTVSPGITQRGQSFAINYYAGGKRYTHSLRGCALEDAIEYRKRLVSEAERLHPRNALTSPRLPVEARTTPWSRPKQWMPRYFRKVIQNAKARGIEVLITEDEAAMLLLETKGFCAVTGLPFSEATQSGWRIAPYKPSLDRLDSSQPYSLENCRWVCAAVNIALADYGEKVFREMALAYAARVLQAVR